MLKIIEKPVTLFMQNARILACEECDYALVIDPGGDSPLLIEELKRLGVTRADIWLTHSHLDHCGAVKEIKAAFPGKLLGHSAEQVMRKEVVAIAAMYGVPPGHFSECPEPDTYIEGNQELSFGTYVFKTLFTPGHSPGHICFYCEEEKLLLAGDTLFASSIGRSDLPGGDYATLMQSINEKLMTLPDDTRVLSGHGPNTTIGAERRNNPFIN